ncbi:MAG: CRTAC1 family protein [Verrucomicrobiales bacterium]|nr:CRTAC1 family protein [Verrucomicrobiales bacterium]
MSTPVGSRSNSDFPVQSTLLEAREQKVAETDWAQEIFAQECGRTFEVLWDSLNASNDKLKLVANFAVGEIVLGNWRLAQSLPHGIELREPAAALRPLPSLEWRRFVEESERGGWQLVQTEFRHNQFETDPAGRPRRSHFHFSAHLLNAERSERVSLEGSLIVDWAAERSSDGLMAVKQIDASRLTLKKRRGEPPFQPILSEQIMPPKNSPFIDPLIVYDLNGDGLSEIMLPAMNLIYRRRGNDRYEAEPLCRDSPGLILTALIADMDGDGSADLLGANSGGLVLFKGSPGGTFEVPGQPVWGANPHLVNPMVLSCGDIDHDGDLDVFLGQYRVPTLGQILRPSFYDANDGHPAYLLLNDGHGRFEEATAGAGLEKKRNRRIFSASLVDLTDDGDLDLVVVSDFAGVDLYENDGKGQFTDRTTHWVATPEAFGMAHALADFNTDARLDLLLIGMTSPTVDRLEHLGLTRRGSKEDPAMRRRMTYGNRLYLARINGGFEQTPLSDSIARSGWSWGCSAFDFDNDGFPDVYVANGNESQRSVRDYEPEFWLHDIYIDESVDDVSATHYLTRKHARTRGQGWSYGGYEKNRLFLNRGGRDFLEVGHLFGVALEQDSRNVVATDLDRDGRVDLIVTTAEVWPERKHTIRVYENRLAEVGHWIGFQFREEGLGKSPAGVRVTLRCGERNAVRQIVTGDSLRSQHPAVLHFGLSGEDRVHSAEIRWPDGRAVTIENPPVDRYHNVLAPESLEDQ